jgi:hypothetical protein
MSDKNDFPPEEIWDEYVWERFLQQQDRNTEKYFQLLEKYHDDPDRDDIIAEEMGWDVFASAQEDQEEVEDFLAEATELLVGESEEEEEDYEDEFEEFTQSPVYEDTLRLHRWVNNLFNKRADLRENPEAVRFATRSAVCGAKLAAALCGTENSEIGMTIAYLKRSLKSANESLESAQKLADSGHLDRRRANHARRLVFSIRNRIVDYMREFRLKWHERHGH